MSWAAALILRARSVPHALRRPRSASTGTAAPGPAAGGAPSRAGRRRSPPSRAVTRRRFSDVRARHEAVELCAQAVEHRPGVVDLLAVGDDPEVEVVAVAHDRDVEADAV